MEKTVLFEKKRTIKSGEESFTESDIQKLFDACNTMETEIIILLGISIGLRRTDMAKLKVQDIDLKNGELKYYEHKKDRIRTVPVSKKLCQKLEMYINTLGKNNGYLFKCGVHKWGDRTLWNRLNELCDRAGVRRRKFHALRATCYKLHQKKGWTPQQSADLIGDTPEVAALYYGTPSRDDMRELTDKLDVI